MDTTTAKALALRVSVKLGTGEQEALQFIWLGCVEGTLRPMYEDGEPFPVHVPTEEMEPVVDLWGRRLPRACAVVKNLATTFEDFEQVSHVLRFRAREADDFLAYLDARAIERAAESTPHDPAAPEFQVADRLEEHKEESLEGLVNRLRAAGEHDPKALARHLKEAFPALPPAAIGKLLPADPSPSHEISWGGHNSRGLRLLGRKK